MTDEDTIFATLIMQSAAIPNVELYPRPLMRWSERLYAHVFNQYGQFSLQENGQLLLLFLLLAACDMTQSISITPVMITRTPIAGRLAAPCSFTSIANCSRLSTGVDPMYTVTLLSFCT